jgi:hypothetical protein
MSMELYLFLNRADLPSPEVWQQRITQSGFRLQLDTDFDPVTFTGFLPCMLEGQQLGFEYYFVAKDSIAPSDTYLAPVAQPFDSIITLVWGGSLREMAAVMMAAGALSAALPSCIYMPEDDSTIAGEQALSYAREQIADVERYLQR